MPLKKEPLKVNCFRCKNDIFVKYVRASKDYSKKNSWENWTEDKKNHGYYLCDICLLELFHNHKREFHQLVTERRKKTFREYINKKTIKGELKSSFLVSDYVDKSDSK